MNEVEHILKNAQRITMTAEEKALMKERLSAFADAHPAGAASPFVFVSGWTETAFVYARRHYAQMFAVLIFIMAGSITALADGSLPGDPLYAVKVRFNEEVTGSLAFSDEAKAEHETLLAEKRLQEAASLSVQGRLTNETRAQIEGEVQKHVQNVEASVAKLESENNVRGAVEVNSELESSLSVHAQVLSDLSGQSEEAGTVASALRQQLTSVSQKLSKLEGKISNEVSVEAEQQAQEKSLRAEAKLDEIRSKTEEEKDAISSEAYAEIQTHIDLSLEALSEGYVKMQNGSYNKAFVAFQESIQQSKQARLLLAASKDFKIDAPVSDPSDEATSTDATSTASTTDTETSDASLIKPAENLMPTTSSASFMSATHTDSSRSALSGLPGLLRAGL